MDERIAALTAQIEKLQAENTFLKCLLDEAGISYVLPASKPTAEISKQLARRFYSYFWGRTDVYGKRSVNKTTGKAGYYPQCENLWKDGICPKKSGKKVKCGDCANRKWRQLEAEQIMAHLRGEKPYGSYTHLRAHETLSDLVCRLLLEKKIFLMIRRPPRSTLLASSAASASADGLDRSPPPAAALSPGHSVRPGSCFRFASAAE